RPLARPAPGACVARPPRPWWRSARRGPGAGAAAWRRRLGSALETWVRARWSWVVRSIRVMEDPSASGRAGAAAIGDRGSRRDGRPNRAVAVRWPCVARRIAAVVTGARRAGADEVAIEEQRGGSGDERGG